MDILREVHTASGYPRNWPADPASWVASGSGYGAWVAETPALGLIGHVALGPPGDGDAAPTLTPSPGQVAVVARLFVSPRARGLGAGRALLAETAEHARTLGRRAVLDVVSADTASVAFYAHAGWERLGSGKQDWGGGIHVPVHCFGAPLQGRGELREQPPTQPRGRAL
ncbi:GNAT family N-acetyltransferase [Streptomyces spiroverticillatus]|uniref:GNAT family N-acetyltransferase n=1 Tax=Streptomyces finlayi TaxID=67296 RepID=A0A919C892_9ACTN|nr:GNAT family N-acetyltransferase [Streptomyces spiroverticillatus]GHC83108.1 GNAT family N-acetyltransferase [Streptomyces finlayi]